MTVSDQPLEGKQIEQTILARDAVVDRVCAERGWDKDNLTITQIMEIRALPEWKDA